jgi:hypothetical protein
MIGSGDGSAPTGGRFLWPIHVDSDGAERPIIVDSDRAQRPNIENSH